MAIQVFCPYCRGGNPPNAANCIWCGRSQLWLERERVTNIPWGTSEKNLLPYFIQPGERLLWEGRPNKRSFMLRGSWWMIPFSLLVCAIPISTFAYWLYSLFSGTAFRSYGSPTSQGSLGLLVIVGIILLAGMYLLFGRYLIAAREADNTYYMLTNHRVLIQGGAINRIVTESSLKMLGNIEGFEDKSGIGTIYFGEPIPAQRYRAAGYPLSRYVVYRRLVFTYVIEKVPELACIDHSKEVYDLARSARYPAVRQ